MGKIDYFKIILDRKNAIYYPGQALMGNLKIRIEERLKINCVKLVVNGTARVQW
jgi:hypothetical protein